MKFSLLRKVDAWRSSLRDTPAPPRTCGVKQPYPSPPVACGVKEPADSKLFSSRYLCGEGQNPLLRARGAKLPWLSSSHPLAFYARILVLGIEGLWVEWAVSLRVFLAEAKPSATQIKNFPLSRGSLFVRLSSILWRERAGVRAVRATTKPY